MRTIGVTKLRDWDFTRHEGEIGDVLVWADDVWEHVTVPHDWAIHGEFRRENDLQETRVIEDGDVVAHDHTGRTGGLPHVGRAWYRRRLDIPASEAGKSFILAFDGVMSHSTVYVNGKPVGGRPFGYASFEIDATDAIRPGGENVVHVLVDNPPFASRWYPGAGIYREARLLTLDPAHFETFGVWARSDDFDSAAGTATLTIEAHVAAPFRDGLVLEAFLYDAGTEIAHVSVPGAHLAMPLSGLRPWSPDNPHLYGLSVRLVRDGVALDEERLRYGFRTIVFDPDKGMSLNGAPIKMRGVCQHHDLGPVGAAFLPAAARRQLLLLKSIGCNAIRTAHNPPAPQLLDLCDELGFLGMDEAFDEWRLGKVDNGYHVDFDAWHKRDLADFIRRDRNHACVAFWSIGNEIREIFDADGWKVARDLVDICHAVDPTRKVTAGMNISERFIGNGFVSVLDLAGYNYQAKRYATYKTIHPQIPAFGSETASTTSARGYYDFPVVPSDGFRENGLCSSYDLEHPAWATTPEEEFAGQDTCPWLMGEFVWTGTDYLGEPTPYKNLWPSHSSYFGIFDLCGIRKDRAWIYEARWTRHPVVHVLPHWTWPGREGEVTPVHVYTNAAEVELFVNGRSLGRRSPSFCRCRWDDVVYEPGEIMAVGYDATGAQCGRDVKKTAGAPFALRLELDRDSLSADPDDLAFATVSVVDADGNLCPTAANEIAFKVSGAGRLEAVANGDQRCLTPFGSPRIAAFFGFAVAVVRASGAFGAIRIVAESGDLRGAECEIAVVGG